MLTPVRWSDPAEMSFSDETLPRPAPETAPQPPPAMAVISGDRMKLALLRVLFPQFIWKAYWSTIEQAECEECRHVVLVDDPGLALSWVYTCLIPMLPVGTRVTTFEGSPLKPARVQPQPSVI